MNFADHLAFYYRKLRHLPLYSLLLPILALPVHGHAEMYKWVDESGTVHYSQSPPPAGIQGTTVKPPPAVDTDSARARLGNQLESLEKSIEQREKQSSEARQTEQELAEQDRLCQQARARLASYERPRISVPTADGGERRLGEEERQQELQRSRDLIEELCR